MSENNLDYNTVDDVLIDAKAPMEAAEAQGALCGMICASGSGNLHSWLVQVFGDDQDSNNLYTPDSYKVLTLLHEQTTGQLLQSNYELELLLHSDDEPLDIRIEDISNWCQGFLFGLTAAGLKDIDKLPVDAREIIQDMMDISKAGYDQDGNDEENEEAFAEIVEYLRIGAYVVFATFNSDESSAPTIH